MKRAPWEPLIFTAMAFCSMTAGIVLAAKGRRTRVGSRLSRRVAGSVFILGFVLLGVAIGQWDVQEPAQRITSQLP